MLLNPLDPPRANHADDRRRAAPTPPPTPARQPRRLLAHPSEMAIVVRPRFRLDGERESGRRNRQRVDVPAPAPRQGMTHPPPLSVKRRKRTPDFVLRASAHPAALGERQPVASVEAGPERDREQDSSRRHGARARGSQRQHHDRGARHCGHTRSRQPAVLLATRVVQAASWSDGTTPSSHRHPTAPVTRLARTDAFFARSSGATYDRPST
jgi:hypothetical protein